MDWKLVIEMLKEFAAGKPIVLMLITLLEKLVLTKGHNEKRALVQFQRICQLLGLNADEVAAAK